MNETSPLIAWKPKGPKESPRSILEGSFVLFGLPYEAVAIEVQEEYVPDFFGRDQGEYAQSGVNVKADAELYRWRKLKGAKGPYPTLFITNRRYVLFLHPRAFDSSQKV